MKMDAPASQTPDKCLVHDLGLMPFDQALDLQLAAVDDVAAGGQERLFLVEHHPVITLGRNSGREHLLADPKFLAQHGITLTRTSRGGSITCHYPGQIVAYPILRLARRPGGLRRLVHDLEEAAILALVGFGVQGRRSEGRPGVWVKEHKIASIGLGLRKWVSFHGLALNICRDTSLFNLITPCGLHGVRPTSVHRELDASLPDMQKMKQTLAGTMDEILHLSGSG